MSPAVGFSLVYLLAAVIAIAAAAVIWPRRYAPGGTPLAIMLLAAAFWALCDAVELFVPGVAGKRLVSQFQYIGIIMVAPAFFHAAMELAGLATRLTPRILALVWAVPLLSVAIAWTSQWHPLLWTNIQLPQGELPFSIYEYGWWFWVLTAQNYVLMIVATLVLLGAIRRVRRQFRTGMIAVLIAAILPWLGNAAYNAKLGPWPGLNWLTLSLGVSGSLLVWVVLREGLLDLLPRAREALVDKMTDAVLVLDLDGQILFANDTTQALGIEAVGLARALGLKSLNDAPVQWRAEAQIDQGDTSRWFDVRIDPVRDRWGAISGRLLVARDVTLQKTLEDERERLIDELQHALRKVTHLEGLLPICASCRKVRDDGGYWAHVEEYFEQRAPVEFTHAICPDCAPKLYPSIMKR